MKFTKETLLEALKARLTAGGKKLAMSQRTLASQVETLYKYGVNDETELDAFVEEAIPVLETLEGNYRKDNSDFIKDWEKSHKTEPKPTDTPPDDKDKGGKGNEPTGDDRLDKVLKMVEELQRENAEAKRNNAISAKKSALLARFKEKGIKDEAWIADYMADTTLAEDTDIDAKADMALRLFNKANAQETPSTTPGSPGAPLPPKDEWNDIVRMRKRGND